MDKLAVALEDASAGSKPGHTTETNALGAMILSAVEGFGEFDSRHGSKPGGEGVCALAEKESGRTVDGEAEEQVLKLSSGAVTGNGSYEMIDVHIETVKVPDLSAVEAGTQHLSGVLPLAAVGDEAARTKEGDDSIDAIAAERPVLEISRKNVLDVYWVAGDDALRAENNVSESVISHLIKLIYKELKGTVFVKGSLEFEKAVDGEDRELVALLVDRLATMFVDDRPAPSASSELCVNIVDNEQDCRACSETLDVEVEKGGHGDGGSGSTWLDEV